MPSLVSDERIISELKRALAETLRIDEAAITPGSSIALDLGADSLDLLDVTYRMEQAFGVKMPRQHFLEHVEEMFGEGTALDDEGRLTETGVSLLRIRYADMDLFGVKVGMPMEEVAGLITVSSMTAAIAGVLASLPERCECGAASWHSDDGRGVVCGSCGGAAAYVNGDELTRRWLEEIQEESGLFGRRASGAPAP